MWNVFTLRKLMMLSGGALGLIESKGIPDNMRRRSLLKVVGGTATASTVALSGCLGIGSDVDLTDLQICTSTPPDTNLSNFMDYFVEEMEERSDGEMQFEAFYSNELGSPTENYDAVQRGAQFGYVYAWPTYPVAGAMDKIAGLVLPYQYIGEEDAYNEKMNDLYWEAPDMMSELNEELVEETNMRFVESGAAMLGKRGMTANSALDSSEKFEGLDMRSAEGPMYTAIVEGLGGNNIQVATEDTPQALQTGQIDVNIWPVELLFLTETYQFHDYFHVTNQYIQDVPCAVSQDIWSEMSEDLQQVVEDAAEAASRQQLNELIEQEAGFIDTMEDEGITVLQGAGVDIDENPYRDAVEAKVEEDLPEAWALIQEHQNAVN